MRILNKFKLVGLHHNFISGMQDYRDNRTKSQITSLQTPDFDNNNSLKELVSSLMYEWIFSLKNEIITFHCFLLLSRFREWQYCCFICLKMYSLNSNANFINLCSRKPNLNNLVSWETSMKTDGNKEDFLVWICWCEFNFYVFYCKLNKKIQSNLLFCVRIWKINYSSILRVH